MARAQALAHMPRKPKYDPASLQPLLLEHVANGNTLAAWCELPGNPSTRCVHAWLQTDDAFAALYARAREIGGSIIAERLRKLAATPSDHPDDVAHRRLQIDVDKWLLARWFPTKYGDRQHMEHGGGVSIQVVTGVPPAGET